ncbi:MAG: hypothetical protein WC284_17875 [Candidimonas sp.]
MATAIAQPLRANTNELIRDAYLVGYCGGQYQLIRATMAQSVVLGELGADTTTATKSLMEYYRKKHENIINSVDILGEQFKNNNMQPDALSMVIVKAINNAFTDYVTNISSFTDDTDVIHDFVVNKLLNDAQCDAIVDKLKKMSGTNN